MIVVFAHTGGLVGAEVGVAGGTAVLAQRILEAVFGDQAIRRLAQTAKDDLDDRVQTLLSEELLRYHRVLDGLQVEAEQAVRLRAAATAVQQARAGGLPSSEFRPGGAGPVCGRGAPGDRGADRDPDSVLPRPPTDDIVDAELVETPREEYR